MRYMGMSGFVRCDCTKAGVCSSFRAVGGPEIEDRRPPSLRKKGPEQARSSSAIKSGHRSPKHRVQPPKEVTGYEGGTPGCTWVLLGGQCVCACACVCLCQGRRPLLRRLRGSSVVRPYLRQTTMCSVFQGPAEATPAGVYGLRTVTVPPTNRSPCPRFPHAEHQYTRAQPCAPPAHPLPAHASLAAAGPLAGVGVGRQESPAGLGARGMKA